MDRQVRRKARLGVLVLSVLPVFGLAGPAFSADAGLCRQGYRQASVIRDFALGREWTVLASCSHPERPRIAIEAVAGPGPSPASTSHAPGLPPRLDSPPLSGTPLRLDSPAPRLSPHASPPALLPAPAREPDLPPEVRAGDRVRLWQHTTVARIDTPALALETGARGASIEVRVLPGGVLLHGTVRGAGSVELEPAVAGFRGDKR